MELDISVTASKEVPGPLGGFTIEYEIAVQTTVPELIRGGLKNYFTVGKSFREIEDFQAKLSRKFPKNNFSSLGKKQNLNWDNTEERRILADNFFKSLTKSPSEYITYLKEFFNCDACNTEDSTPNDVPVQEKDNFDIFEEIREEEYFPNNGLTKSLSTENVFSENAEKDDKNSESVSSPLFEDVSPTHSDKPFYIVSSNDQSLFSPTSDQEMTEIKCALKNEDEQLLDSITVNEEIKLLSIDDNLTDLLETLQKKKDSKPLPPPKPLRLGGPGERPPVPLPRTSLQPQQQQQQQPQPAAEPNPEDLTGADILKYIEREQNKDPELDLF